jgi:hypothetical protein
VEITYWPNISFPRAASERSIREMERDEVACETCRHHRHLEILPEPHSDLEFDMRCRWFYGNAEWKKKKEKETIVVTIQGTGFSNTNRLFQSTQ